MPLRILNNAAVVDEREINYTMTFKLIHSAAGSIVSYVEVRLLVVIFVLNPFSSL